MRLCLIAVAVAQLATWAPLSAQRIELPPSLEKLADTAQESVNVTLDGPLLQLAGKFMSNDDEHAAQIKKILSGLQGVYVRSFEFANEGAFQASDVDAVRSRYQGTGWSRIVGVKSKDGDDADVFVKSDSSGNFNGLAVICAGKTELTFVNIVGTIDPTMVGQLGGEFGIPCFSGKWHCRDDR